MSCRAERGISGLTKSKARDASRLSLCKLERPSGSPLGMTRQEPSLFVLAINAQPHMSCRAERGISGLTKSKARDASRLSLYKLERPSGSPLGMTRQEPSLFVLAINAQPHMSCRTK